MKLGEKMAGENEGEGKNGEIWVGGKWLGGFQSGETPEEILAGRFQPSALNIWF